MSIVSKKKFFWNSDHNHHIHEYSLRGLHLSKIQKSLKIMCQSLDFDKCNPGLEIGSEKKRKFLLNAKNFPEENFKKRKIFWVLKFLKIYFILLFLL